MSDDATALLQQALTLPVHERPDLAASLLASLDQPAADDPPTMEKERAQELERRARRALAGESAGQPWDQARQVVRDRLSGG